MIWLLTGFVGFVITSLIVLAVRSRRAPPLGLVAGRLQPCSRAANCVCTEAGQPPPLPIRGSPAAAWDQARRIIRALGGVVERDESGYLHATFTTRVFRFVDDFELRLDEPARVIHLRASARVGQRDLGVNRRRVEQFQRRYAAGADAD